MNDKVVSTDNLSSVEEFGGKYLLKCQSQIIITQEVALLLTWRWSRSHSGILLINKMRSEFPFGGNSKIFDVHICHADSRNCLG